MKTFQLKLGLVITQYEEFHELVAIDNTSLTFEEINTRNKTIITNDDFWIDFASGQVRIADAFSSSKELITHSLQEAIHSKTDLASFPEKYQRDVNRKTLYIAALKKLGISRGQRRYIAAELDRIGRTMGDQKIPKPSTVQRWWHQFEANGGYSYSLLNANSSKRSPNQFSQDSEDFIQAQIDQCYAIRTRPGVASAYRGYLQALKVENTRLEKSGKPLLEKASERTFHLRIQKGRSLSSWLIDMEGLMQKRTFGWSKAIYQHNILLML